MDGKSALYQSDTLYTGDRWPMPGMVRRVLLGWAESAPPPFPPHPSPLPAGGEREDRAAVGEELTFKRFSPHLGLIMLSPFSGASSSQQNADARKDSLFQFVSGKCGLSY